MRKFSFKYWNINESDEKYAVVCLSKRSTGEYISKYIYQNIQPLINVTNESRGMKDGELMINCPADITDDELFSNSTDLAEYLRKNLDEIVAINSWKQKVDYVSLKPDNCSNFDDLF